MGEAAVKILCTGSCGYIGSILVPMLVAEGHHVTGLDFLIYQQSTLLEQISSPRFDFYKVDCRNPDAVRPHLKDADVVIPLAGLVGQPLGDLNPVDAELINLRAPLALFKELSRDQFVVMPTTESGYGSNAEVCTEETKLNPLSTYAAHKVQVEEALMTRGNAISLRLATVFGMSPRMRLDLLINDFTWRALKDRALVVFEANAKRTCVHVRDVARAFLHALDCSVDGAHQDGLLYHLPEGIYNIGAVTLTKLSLCEEIRKQVPGFFFTEAQYGTDPDARDYIVSDAKIRATGYAPQVTLQEGIAELLRGYRLLGSNSKFGNV